MSALTEERRGRCAGDDVDYLTEAVSGEAVFGRGEGRGPRAGLCAGTAGAGDGRAESGRAAAGGRQRADLVRCTGDVSSRRSPPPCSLLYSAFRDSLGRQLHTPPDLFHLSSSVPPPSLPRPRPLQTTTATTTRRPRTTTLHASLPWTEFRWPDTASLPGIASSKCAPPSPAAQLHAAAPICHPPRGLARSPGPSRRSARYGPPSPASEPEPEPDGPAAPAAPPRSSAAPPATLSALHSARCSQRSPAVTVHFDHWQCTVPALLIQPSP